MLLQPVTFCNREKRLTSKKCWLYLYAQQLNSQLSTQISHYRLSLLIMDEMGLKSRTTLWSYLNG
ncbi:hypothetical protein GH742_02320 [Legionella sp. MW5194]|nr:hypothetical protein GH742_02320 [Legionella sp. MW5194]